MKNTRTDILVNKHGLEFEVEAVFLEKDDHGKPINEWMFDQYNTAKCIVYKDRKTLLPPEEESKAIAVVLTRMGGGQL
jgi:hypothetical protein